VQIMKFSAYSFLQYPVTFSTHFFLFLSIMLHGDCINMFYIFMFTSYEIPETTVLEKLVCASYGFQIACVVAFTLKQACLKVAEPRYRVHCSCSVVSE
jgi:hypothetical protein